MTFGLVIFVIVFMLVVAGIAFVSQFAPKDKDKPGVVPTAEQDPLSFPQKRSQWDPEDPEFVKEFENTREGHYHFPFENQHDEPVEMGLISKTYCTCANVEACIVSAEDAKALLTPLTPAGMAPALHLINTTPTREDGVGEFLGRKMDWVELVPDKPSVRLVVPPRQGGLLRVSWKADTKKTDLVQLRVRLWTLLQKSRRQKNAELEAQARVVPAFRTVPRELDLSEWNDAGEARAEFRVLSSTRNSFPLVAEVEKHDPCFQLEVSPLDNQACLQSQKAIASATRQNIRILSGYKVKVTARQVQTVRNPVNHQEEEKVLEQGRFIRSIDLRFSNKGPVLSSIKVLGFVRGLVRVEDNARGEIRLEPFSIKTGSDPKTVNLKVEPGVELEMNAIQTIPHFMKATLKKVSGNRWKLTVIVPPNSPIVGWPEDSAVIVQTRQNGKPPRRSRFPVIAVPKN